MNKERMEDNLFESQLREIQTLQRRWRFGRWMQLTGGSLSLALGVWLAVLVHERVTIVEQTQQEDITWAVAVSLMFIYQGIWLSGLAMARWRGDPVLKLLVRLIETTRSSTPKEL
jgi:hypothetical protein